MTQEKAPRLMRGHHGLYTLWLNDEAPRIGSGLRVVEIHVGNRKVTLRCPFRQRKATIYRTVFDKIWADSIKQRV